MNTRLLMMMHVKVAAVLNVGAVPHGIRRTAPLAGGTFEGPRLRGAILPGSADWQLLRPDGVLEMDLRFTLETDDGALISMSSFGLRHGPHPLPPHPPPLPPPPRRTPAPQSPDPRSER